MKIITVLIFTIVSVLSWTADTARARDLCTDINQELPDQHFASLIIRAVCQQLPEKEKLGYPVSITKIDRYMAKEDWHVVWATPENMEPGVFLLRGDVETLQYVAVWGGVVFEESIVFQWLKEQAPGAPVSLLACAAHAITYEQGFGE